MTRRLVLAIVGSVVGALVLAGVGTLVLVRLGAREETRRELEDQATDIVGGLGAVPPRAQARLLRALRRVMDLEELAVVSLGPGGRTLGLPPAGLDVADLDVERLAAGDTVSGARGGVVFAATALPVAPRGLAVVVLTRRADTGLRAAVRWFTVAAVVTLLVAVAVATRLGRGLTRPIRATQEATGRIAAGDLSARVPDLGGDDELASLARSVNAMAAELERSRGLERQFLLSISHDLRTPLTSIRGFAEAIADGVAEDHRRAAVVIAAEARRLERLVRDLLELGRLDARRFSLDVRATDVAEVVADTAEGFRPAAVDADVALALAGHQGAPLLAAADPDRLAQVVANLVENALKFAATSITVGTAAGDGTVVVWVDDDGPGIAADDLPHVFDRLSTSRRAPAFPGPGRPGGEPGSGLGLAIARELVEAMGGRVEAHSAGTSGTRMVVTLRAWGPA